MRAFSAAVVLLPLNLAIGWAACSQGPPPPLGQDDGGGNAQSSGAQFQHDGASICGNEVHQAQSAYPLIYFVIDRSGSMSDPDPGSGQNKLERVQEAAGEMVDSLGTLVRVGAAMYPNPAVDDNTDGCAPGVELFTPKVGAGSAFSQAINVDPFGGTPTAATLNAVAPTLAAAAGPKALILATDGAPNCNPNITCGPAECMPNILGLCAPDDATCCTPPTGIHENCVDRAASILAVQAIFEAGTPVYVIGIPGTELFESTLNQMALVGGAAQEGADTAFYKVDDLDTLASVFKDIAGELVSCSFDLADPPEDPGKTNVYFDEVVVPQDPDDGWIWIDEDTIELVGASCASLKNGEVRDVQIVSGCPTVVPL